MSGRWKPNPYYKPNPRPPREEPRVSVRCDLLKRAAELIADQDPSLATLFARMAANPEQPSVQIGAAPPREYDALTGSPLGVAADVASALSTPQPV